MRKYFCAEFLIKKYFRILHFAFRIIPFPFLTFDFKPDMLKKMWRFLFFVVLKNFPSPIFL